ncbi:MAG: hypothetical protein ACRCZS_20955 [Chroococcidiopsis sp.]
MREVSLRLLFLALRRVLFPERRFVLRQLVAEVVDYARYEDYHFSDVLLALAWYAKEESSVDPDTQETRSTVASLLETAAIEAETKGRELP